MQKNQTTFLFFVRICVGKQSFAKIIHSQVFPIKMLIASVTCTGVSAAAHNKSTQRCAVLSRKKTFTDHWTIGSHDKVSPVFIALRNLLTKSWSGQPVLVHFSSCAKFLGFSWNGNTLSHVQIQSSQKHTQWVTWVWVCRPCDNWDVFSF